MYFGHRCCIPPVCPGSTKIIINQFHSGMSTGKVFTKKYGAYAER